MKVFFFSIILFASCLFGQNNCSLGSEENDNAALRSIVFAGYNWAVKASASPEGPGPNYFSDSSENVRVDSVDHLHLRITRRNGKWYCAEVILQESLGYGTYVFNTISRVGAFNENIVLGLFTWDNFAPNEDYREIDIEFSRWGDANNQNNAQYTVQPYYISGNIQRWHMPEEQDSSTHIIDWQQNAVNFRAYYGVQNVEPFDSLLYGWDYFGQHFPEPGNENIRINLWLMSGLAPTDSQEQEIIISGFEYLPPEPDALYQNIETRPRQFTLYQNYPNPFNSQTVIAYNLPSADFVSLKIYNLLGIEIATLAEAFQRSGYHKVIYDAIELASGIYYYKLSIGKNAQSQYRKMILIR